LAGRLRLAGMLCMALVVVQGCGGFGRQELTVIVISLDTTRPDHLTPYDPTRATTPTLARLAREGTQFTGARSTAPWTLPAHMSLFTGLPPGLHDVNIDFQVLDKGRPTMGELFQAAGFRTMGIFTAPYVHGRFGFDRGMDFYERATIEPMLWDLPPDTMREQMQTREFFSHLERTSRLLTERALALLSNSTRERNLLFLHYFDPHYDYLADASYLKRFADPSYRGPIVGRGIAGNPALGPEMSAADRAQLEALYDAEIASVDDSIAALLGELERQDRLDSTLILVTGDHGEAFFEHGIFGHRRDLKDEVLRVPLIVWGPGLGITAGRVVDETVSLVDVLPTLLDYAGLPAEARLEGRSLRPLIEGTGWSHRPITAALSFFPADAPGYYELHESLTLDSMKLHRKVHVSWSPENERELGGQVLPGSEVVEVYDLDVDPGETENLVDSKDPRVEALISVFHEERARQRQSLAAFRPQGHGAANIDVRLNEMLQANGYLQGTSGPEDR
jgi:arylsulfatase A-like enzyme